MPRNAVLDRQVAQLRDRSRRMVRSLGFLGERFDEFGCTAAQCHTLTELSHRGRLTSAQLAELLVVDRSTISRAIRPLLDENLIAVVPDPSDSRSKPLELTEQGRTRVSRIDRSADAQVRAALSQLNNEQREQVVSGIGLYQQALHRANAVQKLSFRSIEKTDDADMAHVIRTVMTEFGAVGCGFSIEDDEVDQMYASYQGTRSRFFVASKGTRLLGGAGIGPLDGAESRVCELRKMYILPEARGLGVGSKLLRLCLDAAHEVGFEECYLETLGHMTQARHLYEKNGFTPITEPMGNTGHFGCDHWYVRRL